MHQLSPKFQIDLTQRIVDRIQNVYPHANRHMRKEYLKKWQGDTLLGQRAKSDFYLKFHDDYENDLDLYGTIYNIPSDILIKIAIDLDLDVPGFIPCVPTFKLDLKASYNRAYNSFETAWKLAHTEPENSAGFANSSLESLMKELLKAINPNNNYDRETSKDLIKIILKAYKMYPYDGLHNEVKTMAHGFISICTAIDDLRSNKTLFHGKTSEDLLIEDSVFSFFIVNAVATVGSFLKSFHELHAKNKTGNNGNILFDQTEDFQCEQDFTYLKYSCTNSKAFIKDHFLLPHVIGHFGRSEFNSFDDSSIFHFQKSVEYVNDDLLLNEMVQETYGKYSELFSFLGFLWFIKDNSITVSSTTAAMSDPSKKCFQCSGGLYYYTMVGRSGLTKWSLDEINRAYNIHFKAEQICKTLAAPQSPPHYNNDPVQIKVNEKWYEDKDINRIERMIKFWVFMRGQEDAITKLSLCIPILECLFSNSNTDITFQVAMRVANYSSSTQEERKRIFTLVKEVYNIRSQFFHGDVVTKTTTEVKDYCLQMDVLLRTVMTKVIMTDSEIFLQDKKRMKNFYEDLLF